jgi:hypothetical protein
MTSFPISTSSARSSESAPERLKHSRELSAELTRRFQGFDRMLDRLLDWSSGDSRGVPVDLSTSSDSAAA